LQEPGPVLELTHSRIPPRRLRLDYHVVAVLQFGVTTAQRIHTRQIMRRSPSRSESTAPHRRTASRDDRTPDTRAQPRWTPPCTGARQIVAEETRNHVTSRSIFYLEGAKSSTVANGSADSIPQSHVQLPRFTARELIASGPYFERKKSMCP